MSARIPASWAESTFSELNQFDSKTIDPAQFPNEEFELYSVPTFPTGTPEFLKGAAIGSTKQSVEPNDVLVCKINPRINRVWQVDVAKQYRQIASSEWIGFRSHVLHTKFYRHYFTSTDFRELICTDVTGVGGSLTRAQPKKVATFPVPVAPLPEQKRIADKLDAVLARVDACRDRLDRIPAILKRFRQSVLAAATSGKLTEDWRQGKNEWVYSKAENLCEWITKGTTPPKSSMYEGRGDVPYIKVYNLCFDGRLDFTINPTFVDKDTHEVLLKRSKVFPGDVLMNIVGPPLGKVSIVPTSFPEWNINQAIAVFRVKGEIYNRFLAYFLMCETTIAGLIRKSKATAGQFNLTLEVCRQIEVPLPSMEEQTEIVRRVEALFAYADRLEARHAAARAQVEKLTPATLAKAFRGELVPQDPNDEPASVLLERIKGQHSDQTRTNPKRSCKVAA